MLPYYTREVIFDMKIGFVDKFGGPTLLPSLHFLFSFLYETNLMFVTSDAEAVAQRCSVKKVFLEIS